MLIPRSIKIIGMMFVLNILAALPAWALRPSAEEMAGRDRWVSEHFPISSAAASATAAPSKPEAGLMVWINYGPVICNRLPNLPLQIADQKFEHGIYCHAPSRVGVTLPRPGKTLTAVIGILTNPNSQGGSVIPISTAQIDCFPFNLAIDRLVVNRLWRYRSTLKPCRGG